MSCPCSECHSKILGLGFVNEGILLRANSLLNQEDNLHFYYSQNAKHSAGCPELITVSDSHVTLRYVNEEPITVRSTLNMSPGLLNFTLNNTHIVNRNVSLSWEQHTNSRRQNCSVWALDNVRVNLHYQKCTRTLLDDDFEDAK